MSQNEQGGSAQLSEEAAEDLIFRIGKLTRMLRDNMRELGLDKEIEKAAEAIPDARDRLHYVATMTEQAADRALNAIDRAQPLQDQLSERAEALDKRWAEWFEAPKELDDAKVLVKETRTYLSDVPEITSATNKELMDIMMAQDFQDLTGQVIKKMMDVIREIEHQLVQVLIDNVPGVEARETMQRKAEDQWKNEKARRNEDLLNGPQVKGNAPDIVTGHRSIKEMQNQSLIIEKLQTILKSPSNNIIDRVETLLDDKKVLEKKIKNRRTNTYLHDDILVDAEHIGSYQLCIKKIQVDTINDLKILGDKIFEKLNSGICALFSEGEEKPLVVIIVSKDLNDKGVLAGNLAKSIGQFMNGGGGGKPHLATAGGQSNNLLDEAIKKTKPFLLEQLKN